MTLKVIESARLLTEKATHLANDAKLMQKHKQF